MWLRFVAGVGVASAAAGAGLGWLLLTPAAALRAGPAIVEIPPQQSLVGVVATLREAGVIRSRAAFAGAAVLRGSWRRLKAGEYEIPRGASTLDVLRLLEAGRVRPHLVLHPEGATVSELARTLETQRLAPAAVVAAAARDPRVVGALGVEAPTLEGYLFPDSYHFVRGMPVEEMLGRMVQRLRAKLAPELVAKAEAQGFTLHELLTLASIVEREAVARDERRVIAAVFRNRLRRDMPLQADPTVQYALGKERRALTRADLAADHPYNTYVRRGLPPGPIASPGLEAIEAVLDPAPVKYLYFVAIDERRHHFSTTVEEHNAAVARYRLSRR
jgi:UPF0755 protein